MISGKGMFIWQIERSDGDNPAHMVQLARAAGLGHVLVKIADGDDSFPFASQDPGGTKERQTAAAIRALKQAGIEVWGWQYTYGRAPEAEARAAAQRVRQFGLDGFVINAEVEYIGQHDAARRYMNTLRGELGNDPNQMLLALSSFRFPDIQDAAGAALSRRFPFDIFVEQCDIVMPQVYWVASSGGDPADQLRESYAQYHRRYPHRTYIPTGAAYGESYGTGTSRFFWSASPAQIQAFLNQVRALGFFAANFWSWQASREGNQRYSGTQLWDAVAAYPWPKEDSPDMTNTTVAKEIRVAQSGHRDGVYSGAAHSFVNFLSAEGHPTKYTTTAPSRSGVWALWLPRLGESGKYDIQVYVPGTHATTKRARYHIKGAAGQPDDLIVEIDQSKYYDAFVSLGTFDFDSSRADSGQVNLNNLTGEQGKEIAFSTVRWLLHTEQPVIPTGGNFTSPIGTPEERASGKVWPGRWVDANPFGNRYADSGGGAAYHTGADLNLNYPNWDSDRDAPVYAIGSGVVTFAGALPVWGNVIVIRHDPPTQGDNYVWTRYAHVSDVRVSAGQRVERGERIARVSKPAPVNAPYHLHFDVSLSGVIETNPGHWPQLNWNSLINNYTDPKTFLESNR